MPVKKKVATKKTVKAKVKTVGVKKSTKRK
jgi:hypothetical protein